MSALTATRPIEQHPDDAIREYGLAVINACLVDYDRGMRAADDATLLHESERLECQVPSPVVKSMRLIVDGVRQARREAVTRA